MNKEGERMNKYRISVSERLALSCASGFIKSTSKGLCRRSKIKGINSAISNVFLAGQELVSLKELWINIHNKLNTLKHAGCY